MPGARPRILLQTSIPYTADDWHVGRFSLLTAELGKSADVVARNRELGPGGVDPLLASLGTNTDFDEVWLLAVDGGEGFSPAECTALNAFHERGGGILTARDHCNMGMWLRALAGVGAANFFHDQTCWELDPERRVADDTGTPSIEFPNYHSGANGDVQRVDCALPDHPLVATAGGHVGRFPAHPHEGAIAPPAGDTRAKTVARGTSGISGRSFDLIVAFDRDAAVRGRAVVHSSFHHFADLNWNPALGAPSFVTEPPGDAVQRDPQLLADVRAYVGNCAAWLRPTAS